MGSKWTGACLETTGRRPVLCRVVDRRRGDPRAVECCEGQDDEADAAQEQRDSDDDSEQAESVGHVGGVQRGGQRCFRHPEVPDTVRDGLLRCGIDQGCRGIVSSATDGKVCLGRVGLGLEATHLGVGEATCCLERVDPHVAREGACPRAAVDRFTGDGDGRKVNTHETCVLRFLGDQRGSHVRTADDLFQLEAVGHGRAAAEAHDDRDDAEGDQNGACAEAAPLEELAEQVAPLANCL